MAKSLFGKKLREEFEIRRRKNPRYSMRTFAAFLGIDHSSLSQILRERRPIPAKQIRAWGKKLGMSTEEVAAHVTAMHVPEAAHSRREEQLRHWTAEAMAILGEPTHWQIMQLAHSKAFQPDSRWIASEIGATVDEVNVALSRLLRLRLLEMTSADRWEALRVRGQNTEKQFQRSALIRIRELAAERGIALYSR